MVRRTLGLDSATELASDATDALALAVCHLSRARSPRLRDGVERRPRAARRQS
jgi:Holliday junction resolvasome RuvABC endonuclease subunit